MAQSKSSTTERSELIEQLAPRLKEGAFIGLVAIALYLTLALVSFDKTDPG